MGAGVLSNQIKFPVYHLKTALSSLPIIFPICSTLCSIRENAASDGAVAPCKSPGTLQNLQNAGMCIFLQTYKKSQIQLRKRYRQLCSADADDVCHRNFTFNDILRVSNLLFTLSLLLQRYRNITCSSKLFMLTLPVC